MVLDEIMERENISGIIRVLQDVSAEKFATEQQLFDEFIERLKKTEEGQRVSNDLIDLVAMISAKQYVKGMQTGVHLYTLLKENHPSTS